MEDQGRAGAAHRLEESEPVVRFSFVAGLTAWAMLASAARAQGTRDRRPVEAPAPQSPREALQQARAAFEFQDYARVEQLLAPVAEQVDNPQLRAEAYRLLGIARFYMGKSGAATAAFTELLKLNPDEELDPFYVSPRAIAFFDQVKRAKEPELRHIREQRQRDAEERRRAAEAEQAARRQREQEEEARRLTALRPPTILERRVVQREFWVSLMPFGIGQFQNGDQSLGTALATSQIVAGATSAGSALLIEALRDRSTGKFQSGSYNIARNLQIAKWVSAGAFYALWIGGALQAAIKFKAETSARDLVLPSTAQPGLPSEQPPPAGPR
jgi:tetratricopeptide (TPR) repeat protein